MGKGAIIFYQEGGRLFVMTGKKNSGPSPPVKELNSPSHR